MKRQFLLLVSIAVFATALATNASGQTGNTVRAKVKFDFQIGDRLYPAGEYRIQSNGRQPNNILRISSAGDVSKTEFFVAKELNVGKMETPKLLFKKYGETYFLTQIFLDSGQWGYSIRPSRRQRERERNLALASLETIEGRLAKQKGDTRK